MPTVTVGTDANVIANAEEAVEIPPIVPIDLNATLITDINQIPENYDINKRRNVENKSNDRREIFQKIGQQEFEDVVFTPERKQKKTRIKAGNGSESVTSPIDNIDLSSSLSIDHVNTNKTTTTYSSLMQMSLEDDFILKSDRDLKTIQRDVEDKEKLLADVLDFDLSKYMTSSRIKDDSNISNDMDSITCSNYIVHSNNEEETNEEEDANKENENIEQSDYTEGTESGEEDVSYRTELKRLEDLGECRKTLLQNKPDDIPPTRNNFVDIRQVPSMERDELEHQFNGR